MQKIDWKTPSIAKSFRYDMNDKNGMDVTLSGKELIFQTPIMEMRHGFQAWDNEKGQTKHFAPLSFHNLIAMKGGIRTGFDSEQMAFLNFIYDLDNQNIFFSNKLRFSSFGMRNQYKRIVNPDFTTPSMSTKLVYNHRSDKFKTRFFDKKGRVIDKEDFLKGAKVIAVIRTSGLWQMNNQTGMSFHVLQMMLIENPVELFPDNLAIDFPCETDEITELEGQIAKDQLVKDQLVKEHPIKEDELGENEEDQEVFTNGDTLDETNEEDLQVTSKWKTLDGETYYIGSSTS